MIRFRDDLSYLPPRNSPPRMAELFVFEVNAGELPVFEAYATTLKEAAEKVGLGRWIGQRALGGNIREVVTLTYYENYADLEMGRPHVRALGAEAALKLDRQLSPAISNVRRFVLRYDPDMSVRSLTTASPQSVR